MLGKNKVFLEEIRKDLIETVTLIEAYIEFED
jgi:tRNA U34 5-carboxymethylaminomethyl modifying GTPase MnmE/TrmE